jgi:hypothetical protein
MALNLRPEPGEYASYYGRYIELVPDGDIFSILADQQEQTQATLRRIDEAKADHRYAPHKWSIKELAVHLVDTERVFTHRALWFARQDPSPLPGMEQDDWARHSRVGTRKLADIGREYAAVRSASLATLRGFDQSVWLNRGIASGREFTVRSIPYILAGHELHHMQVLRQKYL